MRGGKREGAGRKPSEKTVRMSVPVGVAGQVNALIQTYRQEAKSEDGEAGALVAKLQSLKIRQENKQPSPVSEPEPAKPKTNTQRKHEQRLAREQAKKAKKQKTARA